MVLNKIKGISSVIVLLVIAMGCASTSKAPEGNSNQAKTIEAPDGKGTVFLYRTGRAVGAAGQLQVKVNAKDAGGTGPGTFFRWDLKPGTYTFLSSTTESSAVVQVEVKAGQTYYLRQDARIGLNSGRVTMVEVDSIKGAAGVKSCKLLLSSYIPED